MKSLFIALISFMSLISTTLADTWTDHFSIEKIAIPTGTDPQIGGLATLPDQRLVVAFHRGEIMIYDPSEKTWSLFAEGLHEPLGLLVEDQNNVLVMQRPELTRLTDTNGDGKADEYTTVYDDFGMTGNYHEFAFGPVKDAQGNLYIALGVASNGAGIRKEIRGDWNPIGHPREKMLAGKNWNNDNKDRAGRMYGRVPWRGWVVKITPDGKGIPYACGVRSPNGISIDIDGRILVCDNQGDWLGTSKLHHIREGHFHGHPASLIWREGWKKDPLKMKTSELDSIRTRAAGLFPQGELANSPTQPLTVPEGFFPEIIGESLIGDMNQNTLVRYFTDNGIKGATQGATIPFLQTEALGLGNNRLTFTNDGSLWIGKTHLSWAGSEGLLRVKQKKAITALTDLKLTSQGFQLTFNREMSKDAWADLGIKVTSHTYHYHKDYGSKKINSQPVKIETQSLSGDGTSYYIATQDLKEDYLYTFEMKGLTATDGSPLMGDIAYYHLISKE